MRKARQLTGVQLELGMDAADRGVHLPEQVSKFAQRMPTSV